MASDKLVLTPWVHPSMQLPFKFAPEPLSKPHKETILGLMEAVEEEFERQSIENDTPYELQINVLWNVKDHKKALNPNEALGLHFASGDTFGLYGDIVPFVPEKPAIPEGDKLPVVILTGFLGSGKTTLLNYLLKEQRDKKIAIIENEFGEISIDDELLKENQKVDMAEKIIVMDNGCMCCTIRGDLEGGLMEIVKEHRVKKMDCIMIETTGMADPVPIVRTFMASEDLTAELRLDGVVTVADAKNLPGRLADQDLKPHEHDNGKGHEPIVNEAYQQIAFADKIILNKLDLITTDEAIAVKDQIREINAFAKICAAVKGRIKLTELTNMRAHDMTHFTEVDIEKEAKEVEVEDFGHEAGHGGAHGDDGHGDDGHGGGHGDGGHGDGGH
eukprot:2649828-Amphidinium_carterae.1